MPSFLGPPPPIIEPTVEQSFKLRRLEDLLPQAEKEDIITLFMALQRQNFALANTVSNLVKQWPTHLPTTPEAPSNAGTSSEINN
jgi:hypothetical protein